jgi:hypothetical protein
MSYTTNSAGRFYNGLVHSAGMFLISGLRERASALAYKLALDLDSGEF